MDPTENTPHLLYCRCAYAKVVPESVKEAVLEGLCEADTSFETVADLCEMAAHRDPRLQAFTQASHLKIAACYPRVVKGLFQQCGLQLEDEKAEILNMRTETAPSILEKMTGSNQV